MRERGQTSRREFLVSAAMAGAVTGLGCSWSITPGRKAAVAALAALLDESDDAHRLGTEYLSRHPAEADVDTLVTRLVVDLRAAGGELSPDAVQQRITDDFASGRTIRLGGWILSGTELRLCALSALTVRSRSLSSVTGMFPPEVVEGEGLRFRWTSEWATFSVPATAEALGLRLRSLAPFEQRVRVLLDGRPADELILPDARWHPAEYLLPCCERPHSQPFLFELRTTPTWRPVNDFRSLGVQVGETPWTT